MDQSPTDIAKQLGKRGGAAKASRMTAPERSQFASSLAYHRWLKNTVTKSAKADKPQHIAYLIAHDGLWEIHADGSKVKLSEKLIISSKVLRRESDSTNDD